MNGKHYSIIRAIDSDTRRRIIRKIIEGINHPDDIAAELGASRQAIDKQLDILYANGIVEKKAITPPSGRPKIVFKITESGSQLIGEIDRVLEKYMNNIEEELKQDMEELDMRLLQNEISEQAYNTENLKLRKRYKVLTEHTHDK